MYMCSTSHKKVIIFQPNILIEISFMNNKIQAINIYIIISNAGTPAPGTC